MFGKSLANKLKSIDVYKRMPKELSEGTISGALVSIVSIAFIIVLFLYELNIFLSHTTSTEMHVDTGHAGGKIRVNIDIVMPRMPCAIISVDLMDIMGKHEVNMGKELLRDALDYNGNPIELNIRVPDHAHG
jgi:hypothetical protein